VSPILIVEDYEPIRRGIAQALRLAGFPTVEAANGAAALTYLNDGGPAEAIVLDLVMPDMDGWQFRREQERDPWLADIPVIVLSGLDGRPLTGLTASVTLKKPVQPAVLVETVRSVCSDPARVRRRAIRLVPRS
jgi:CheY-like chemotaxis protein